MRFCLLILFCCCLASAFAQPLQIDTSRFDKQVVRITARDDNGLVYEHRFYNDGKKQSSIVRKMDVYHIESWFPEGRKMCECECVNAKGRYEPAGADSHRPCQTWFINGKNEQVYDQANKVLYTYDSLGHKLAELRYNSDGSVHQYEFYYNGTVKQAETSSWDGEETGISLTPSGSVNTRAHMYRSHTKPAVARINYYPTGKKMAELKVSRDYKNYYTFYDEAGGVDTTLWYEKARDGSLLKWGCWKEYYNNGRMASDICYRHNNKEGRAREWYPNGRVRSDAVYQKNYPTGKMLKYYEDGGLWSSWMYSGKESRCGVSFFNDHHLQEQGSIEKGSGHVAFEMLVQYDTQGNVVADALPDRNASRLERIDFSKGKGMRPLYTGQWKNGCRDGEWVASLNGKKLYVLHYADSLLHGKAVYYDSNDVARLQLTLAKGMLNGPYLKLDAAGDTLESGSFFAGERYGSWRTFRKKVLVDVSDYDSTGRLQRHWLQRSEQGRLLQLTERQSGNTYRETYYYASNGKVRDVLLKKQDNTMIRETKYDTSGILLFNHFYNDTFPTRYRAEQYYPDGKLHFTYQVSNRKQEGFFRSYDDKGRLKEEGSYHEGLLQGERRTYNESGGLAAVVIFDKGVELIKPDSNDHCFCNEPGTPADNTFLNPLHSLLSFQDYKLAFPDLRTDAAQYNKIYFTGTPNEATMEGKLRFVTSFILGIGAHSEVELTHCRHGINTQEADAEYVDEGVKGGRAAGIARSFFNVRDVRPYDPIYLRLGLTRLSYHTKAGLLWDAATKACSVSIPVQELFFLPVRNGVLLIPDETYDACANPLQVASTGFVLRISKASLDLLPGQVPVSADNMAQYRLYHYPAHFKMKAAFTDTTDWTESQADKYLQSFMGLIVLDGSLELQAGLTVQVRNWLVDEKEINGLVKIPAAYLENGNASAAFKKLFAAKGFKVFAAQAFEGIYYMPVQLKK